MILKVQNLQEQEMLQEALKVTRKLVARIKELEEEKSEKSEESGN